MADKTNISWTDRTFNPWWGCDEVSPACKNCYARDYAQIKLATPAFQKKLKEKDIPYDATSKRNLWGKKSERLENSDAQWTTPFAWNRRAQREGKRYRVFCGSMMDWAEAHPSLDALRVSLWNVIRATPNLDWLMLTKRPENILSMLPSDWGKGWSHVWMGTTIENNKYVWRADELRKIPAAIRFISYEPALGPLDKLSLKGLHWVIYGGESAPTKKLRRDDAQWARDIKARCEKAGVTFHYKQDSATPGRHVDTLDGKVIQDWPRERIPLTLV